MDKQRRLLIIIVAITIVVGLILGILMLRRNSGNNGTTNEKVELVYWGLWESEEIMAEAISEFQEANPNITVSYSQERFTQYEDNVYARLADPQTTPDIVRINNAWTMKFYQLLSPLPQEIMTPSEYQEAFYPTAYADFMGPDGSLYAIPWEIDGLGLYYNKDLFERAGLSEPPRDWDTVIEYATMLTETDGSGNIVKPGIAMGCSNNINHSADILAALMLQNNVEMTSDDGTVATFTEDSSKRDEGALTFYANFVEEHGVWDCTLRNDLEMFAGNSLAMMIGPSWRTFDIISMNSSVNFDTAPLPQLAGNDDPVHFGMYWGDAVSAQSAHKAEAWKFIKFLSQAEQQRSIYAAAVTSGRAFGEPYSRRELADDISDAPYVAPFITMAPYYTSWKIGDQQISEAALNKAINDVVDGSDNAGSALGTAEDTINSSFAELYGLL